MSVGSILTSAISSRKLSFDHPTRFHGSRENFMAAAKRVKSAEPDKSSPEDERALNRLLALLSGRGEFDWGKLADVEDGRLPR
jgi:hypothetical protein